MKSWHPWRLHLPTCWFWNFQFFSYCFKKRFLANKCCTLLSRMLLISCVLYMLSCSKILDKLLKLLLFFDLIANFIVFIFQNPGGKGIVCFPKILDKGLNTKKMLRGVLLIFLTIFRGWGLRGYTPLIPIHLWIRWSSKWYNVCCHRWIVNANVIFFVLNQIFFTSKTFIYKPWCLNTDVYHICFIWFMKMNLFWIINITTIFSKDRWTRKGEGKIFKKTW